MVERDNPNKNYVCFIGGFALMLDMLKFKCWYYAQAIRDGNEERLTAMIPDKLPEEIRAIYDNSHRE